MIPLTPGHSTTSTIERLRGTLSVQKQLARPRRDDEMRPVTLERGVAPYAEGSCLVSFGSTRVLCTASVEDGVREWKRGSGEGWMTAEYAMLPRATRTRNSGASDRRSADASCSPTVSKTPASIRPRPSNWPAKREFQSTPWASARWSSR